MIKEILMYAPSRRCLYFLMLRLEWGPTDHIVGGTCKCMLFVAFFIYSILSIHYSSVSCWLHALYTLWISGSDPEPTLSFSISKSIKKLIIKPLRRWSSGSTRRRFSMYFGIWDYHSVSRPWDRDPWWYGEGDARWSPISVFRSNREHFLAKLENSVKVVDAVDMSTQFQF